MSDTELWIDSDVARSAAKVRRLGELAHQKGVKVVVHAQVHLEQCRQVREHAARAGKAFSPRMMESFLDQLGIEIADATTDRATAEAWAELLHLRYPTSGAWKDAKLRAVRARLPDEATVPADRVPFTTDWLVALEVERRGAFIAVEDKGEEWHALRTASPKRALTYDEAIAWLVSVENAAPSA